MNKRISLCQLEDIYKSSFGTEDVRIKKFVDKDGKEKYGYITCYGPGISRIYGAMIAYLGDDKGLILHSLFHPCKLQLFLS